MWQGFLEAFSPPARTIGRRLFELLFDLVYVITITQVTGYMADKHSARRAAGAAAHRLWWTWSGYAWPGTRRGQAETTRSPPRKRFGRVQGVAAGRS